MSPGMRRSAFALILIVLVLFVAQDRLSDGGGNLVSPDQSPLLWKEAVHSNLPTAVTYAAAPSNCVFVLSVNRNNPFTLTSVDEGVRFDIDADGDLEQASWTEAASDIAFLALDRDGDGMISSGRDLVGSRTIPGVTSAPNALIQLASDAIGSERRPAIDSGNPLFQRLLLWTDDNHNGISEGSEVLPAHELLSDVRLGFERHHRTDAHGNQSRYRGFVHVRAESGSQPVTSAADDTARLRPMYDVCLVTR